MRIVYLTDLHIGASANGFHQQARLIDVQPELFAAIARLHQQMPVDLLILGGDQTEHGSAEQVERCYELVEQAGVPALVCLGNHDLVEPGALARWQAPRRGLVRVMLADGVVSLDGLDVIALNTWWKSDRGAVLQWDSARAPVAAWGPGQLEWLRGVLGRSDRPAILVMHAPMDPAPTRLTGLPQPIHGEGEEFVAPIERLLSQYPRVRVVLSGHSHITAAVPHPRFTHLTTSSAIEAPFQCRILEMDGRQLAIGTHPLLPPFPQMTLDPARHWAAGHAEDQTVKVELNGQPVHPGGVAASRG